MHGEFFLDSNIFIYSLDDSDPQKALIARGLVQLALDRRRGCVSFQVIQEVLNVVTRKGRRLLSAAETERYLTATLAPLYVVQPSLDLYRHALNLQQRYGFSFYDSLIVSAARLAGCQTLFTEDLQHGQRFEELTIVNPFAG